MAKGKGGKKASSPDNVKVCVRVRPMSSTEKKNKNKSCVTISTKNGQGVVSLQRPGADGQPPRTFTFDNAFPDDVAQVDVYNVTARPIVDSCLEGYNGTIFAYGQTGTGKTHTMEGDRKVAEMRGIIPNSFAHVFGHISKADEETKFLVRCSYMEIYCEEVRDLLAKDIGKKLAIRDHKDSGVYVEDLASFVVKNADDLDKIMTTGNRHRKTGRTNMNERSSRSHAIFTITIECSDLGPDGSERLRMGKLNLVDLAGSERQGKTGAEGVRLQEANKINLSLSTLGLVISSLVDGKSTHVPYRDSKLTRLLQDSLGGNAKTVMIATFGPADYNYDETVSTLRYADNAKKIKNKPKVNEDPKDALLRQFQEQLDALKKQLAGEGGEQSEEESGTEESSSEEETGEVGWDGKKIKKPKKPKGTKGKRKKIVKRPISPSKIKQIQAEIEREKGLLHSDKTMASELKAKAESDLAQREAELAQQLERRQELQQQMDDVAKKVIVGGVNLLEKAEEQQKLLDSAQEELAKRQAEQEQIQRDMEDIEMEEIQIEEQYSSLQEEVAGKTKKLKQVWTRLMAAKADIADMQADHERQTEGIVDNINVLSRQLTLCHLIIDNFIPPEHQEQIQACAQWNEEVEEWHLPYLAYTGNAVAKTHPLDGEDAGDPIDPPEDLSRLYLTYGGTVDSSGGHLTRTARPPTSKSSSSSRPKTGTGKPDQQYPESRPKTAKIHFA